jgi:hypothetical protein
MMLHDMARDVPVIRLRIVLYHSGLRKGLKSEFAVEPVLAAPIPFEGFSSMPYIPQMSIAAARVIVIVSVSRRRMGTGRPVIPIGIELLYDRRYQSAEEPLVFRPTHLARFAVLTNQ